MKTVLINDESRTGKRILSDLRRHSRTVTILEDNEDAKIPEGYVSHQEFWEEADRQLLKAYGKI